MNNVPTFVPKIIKFEESKPMNSCDSSGESNWISFFPKASDDIDRNMETDSADTLWASESVHLIWIHLTQDFINSGGYYFNKPTDETGTFLVQSGCELLSLI